MENICIKIDSLLKKAGNKQKSYIYMIAEEINKNRLAVFIGAGCSIAVGLTSWAELIGNLIDKYQIKTNEKDVLRLAARLEKKLGVIKFREEICDSLKIVPPKESPLHDALIKVETNLYITTNYDSILEDYFKINGIYPAIISKIEDIPGIDPTKKTIVKLHGDINSPDSLVITELDYIKYKENKKAFIDWLNARAVGTSILFIGTSYDDPRLKEVDEYIINMFGNKKRQDFIFLKIPTRPPGISDEDFDITIDDFNALYEDFKDRGFNIFLIKEYEDIPGILKAINKDLLSLNTKESSGDFITSYKLLKEHTDILEKDLRKRIKKEIRDLRDKILGDGSIASISVIKKNLEKLIEYLNSSPEHLDEESHLEGLLTVIDAFLIIKEPNDDLGEVKIYFEKADEIFHKLPDGSHFAERMLRIKARLLFFEDKIGEAVDLLADSQDKKTISFWLSFLIDPKRDDPELLQKAYEFITGRKVEKEWVNVALMIFMEKGDVPNAEELFNNTLADFKKIKESGKLAESEYKNDSFLEQICFTMIQAYHFRAIKLTGKKETSRIFLSDLNDKSTVQLEKCLKYIDLLKKELPGLNLNNSLIMYYITIIEFNVSSILGQFDRAEQIAKELLSIEEPIHKSVVSYIMIRKNELKDQLLRLKNKIEKEHTDKAWGIMAIGDIESFCGDKEKGWDTYKKVFDLPIPAEDKFPAINLGFHIAGVVGKTDEMLHLVTTSPQFDEERKKLWKAFSEVLIEKKENAEESLNTIAETDFSVEEKVLISYLKAFGRYKKGKLNEAKQFLDKSIKIYPDIRALMLRLEILTKEQNITGVIETIKMIESLGIRDEWLTFIKAQALRNSLEYEKSEKEWRYLYEKSLKEKPNPQYARGLADVLNRQDKDEEALAILKDFIQPDNLDFQCLRLTLQIHSLRGENKKAFNVIDGLFDKIQDEPDLLMKHLDLAFKTGDPGDEKRVKESLDRLDILSKEGKVPESVFRKRSIDQIDELKKMVEEARLLSKKINEMYMKGLIFRYKISENNNTSLYLDWAIRTQEISIEKEEEPGNRTDFTIYAANYFAIDYTKNSIAPIKAPKGVQEVVIDYHALITFHRLGLLDKLTRRFKRIYYPKILKEIWKIELSRYEHHQPSKLAVARAIKEKIEKGKFIESNAVLTGKEIRQVDMDLRLAEQERIPLIDNYMKQEELSDFPEVKVIRLSQLLDWIYENGRLTEKKWEETKKYTKGGAVIIKRGWREVLSRSMRFVISQLTLEVLEGFGINQILLDMGVQVYLEKTAADAIRFNIRNKEFVQETAKNQKDLMDKVRDNNKFVEIAVAFDSIDEPLKLSYYDLAAVTILEYADEKDLFILTDDRAMQTIGYKKLFNRQFGSDAALKELYEEKCIDIEEYVEAFLKLCSWRYNFIIPGKDVFVYFARQHRKKLPGTELERLAKYFRQNMNDPGLPLDIVPINPRVVIGYSYYQEVIFTWLEFMVEIWQDDDIDRQELDGITDWFYRYAYPDLPERIPENKKSELLKLMESILCRKLFWCATMAKNHIKLSGFIRQSLDNILASQEEKIQAEIINFIQFLKNYEPMKPEFKQLSEEEISEVRKFQITRFVEAYFGEPNPSMPYWLALHIKDFLPLRPREDDDKYKNYGIAILESMTNFLKEMDITGYKAAPPLINVKKSETEMVLIPFHEMIKHPSVEVRGLVLDKILDSTFISKYTKDNIEKLKKRLLFSELIYRDEAAERISLMLLKDIGYTTSIFKEMKAKGLFNVLHESWQALLKPGIDALTASPDYPLLLKERLSIVKIKERLNKNLKEVNSITKFISFYLKECFFIPVGGNLSPGKFIEEFFSNCEKEEKRKRSKDGFDEPVGKGWKEKLYTDTFYELIEWLSHEKDPLAFLAVLEMVLYTRAISACFDLLDFKSKAFYRFLDKILAALLPQDADEAEEEDKELIKNIHYRWRFRCILSRYYLRYFDLEIVKSIPDEEKVVMAWWTAKKVEDVFFDPEIDIKDQNVFYLQNKPHVIQLDFNLYFEHFFNVRNKKTSIARYYTQYNSPALISLGLSALYPGEDEKNAFYGIKNPTGALNDRFVNIIINFLYKEDLHGAEQILRGGKGELNYLWERPLNDSASKFIKAYYGDAFPYLGKDKVEAINANEMMSKPGYLEDRLTNITAILQDETGLILFLTLKSLELYAVLHGELPGGADIFKDNKEIVDKIQSLKHRMNIFCIKSIVSILGQCVLSGNFQGRDIFGSLINNIDFDQLFSKEENENYLKEILFSLAGITILGYEIPAFKSFLNKRHIVKILETLGKVKVKLEHLYTLIPEESRENLRKILNDLSDVPGIQIKGFE